MLADKLSQKHIQFLLDSLYWFSKISESDTRGTHGTRNISISGVFRCGSSLLSMGTVYIHPRIRRERGIFMNKRNLMPLVMTALLIILICIFAFHRLNHSNTWKDTAINFDIVISAIYVVWMIFESKISKTELSQGNKTSDFGTCELYAIGQAGVILSGLWFNSIWKNPNFLHLLGLLIFLFGIVYRLWAVRTLGRYYSHIVRKVEGHKIIDSGPYRYQRHPAYAGMIIANAGITLFFFNMVTLMIFLIVLIPAIILRIIVEEKTLYKIKGYPDFANSRKRLFPAIW